MNKSRVRVVANAILLPNLRVAIAVFSAKQQVFGHCPNSVKVLILIEEYIFMPFSSLGLCDELLKTLQEQGYESPSAIQTKAIPVVLKHRDVMAVAQTGTGKTAAFTLPIIQLLAGAKNSQAQSPSALVIVPTRELAAQVGENVQNYSRHMNIRSAAVFGGVRIEPQISHLQNGVDLLVATPGRLIDLYNQGALNFEHLDILVLDEADRMLDLGFIDDIRRIQMLLPIKRQTLMFSATFSKQIKTLAKDMLTNPVSIEVAIEKGAIDKIKQQLHPVDKGRKAELLIHLLKKHNWKQVLVFIRTKLDADRLAAQLENTGIGAASIHANRTQHARTQALDGFKSGSIQVLVATDIASRGINVHELPCVINFNLPYIPEDYTHRIGRTGRAGTSGVAISFFSEDESKQLKAIERATGRQLKREIIPGFAPIEKVSAESVGDDEYGNFEADPISDRRGRSRGRKGRSRK
jgi:ATP-dependent RNA helicase RhlE